MNFYTQNGWAGSNYDGNLRTKDIAPAARALLAPSSKAGEFDIKKSIIAKETKIREKHPDRIILIRHGNKYYICRKSAEMSLKVKSIYKYLTSLDGYIYFNNADLDKVLYELIRAGKRVLTCEKEEAEQRAEYLNGLTGENGIRIQPTQAECAYVKKSFLYSSYNGRKIGKLA